MLVVDFPLCNRLFSQPERLREGDRAIEFVAYDHENGTQEFHLLGPMRMFIYTTAQAILAAAWTAGGRYLRAIASQKPAYRPSTITKY